MDIRPQLVINATSHLAACDWIFRLEPGCYDHPFFQKAAIFFAVLHGATATLLACFELLRLFYWNHKFMRRNVISAFDAIFTAGAVHSLCFCLYASLWAAEIDSPEFLGFLASSVWPPIAVGAVIFSSSMIMAARFVLIQKGLMQEGKWWSPKWVYLINFMGLTLFSVPAIVFNTLAGHFHTQGQYDLEQLFFKLTYGWYGVGAVVIVVYIVVASYGAFATFDTKGEISDVAARELKKIRTLLVISFSVTPGVAIVSLMLAFYTPIFSNPQSSKAMFIISWGAVPVGFLTFFGFVVTTLARSAALTTRDSSQDKSQTTSSLTNKEKQQQIQMHYAK